MRLNEIRDNPGSAKPRKRVGRGIGSGMGKTSGRGVKGQKARSGVAIKGFEGGQMPIYRRLPKRGFKPRNKVYYEIVNTGALQKAVDDKRLDAGKGIDRDALVAAGLVRVNGAPTRILGKGELTASLNITAHSVSAGAKEMVQKAGGSVTVEAAPVEAAE
ncbi:50S ribosomal protein L15 [Alphaproteobacteria bacterium]|nr:50S ribosomal protein L15 [Alphaproteobacteria bacterium]